jgi:hypothetical protein
MNWLAPVTVEVDSTKLVAVMEATVRVMAAGAA